MNAEEALYQSLFQTFDHSLCLVDFSKVKVILEPLRRSTNINFLDYLLQNPQLLEDCLRSVEILDLNPATLIMLETNHKEDILKDPSILLKSDRQFCWINILNALVDGKKNYTWTCFLETTTGRLYYAEVQLKIFPGYEENWSCCSISILDITNRKYLESVLKKGKEEWEFTFDALPEIIIITNPSGSIIRCNRATTQLFGVKYSDILDKPLETFWRGVDGSTEEISTALENPLQFRMKDRWFSVSGYPIHTRRELYGYVYICKDITIRWHAEKELQRQNRYLEALLAHSPVAIVTLDLQLRVQGCNPAFEKMFGFSKEEVLGTDLDALITNDMIKSIASDLTQRVTEGQSIAFQGQRSRKDGALLDVNILAVPVLLDGNTIAYLGMYTDITDLIKTYREAERANAAKGEFLATMSHEIRTPLNGVIGMLELALGTPLSADQHDFLLTARESANILLNLLNDILDFSKIEAGHLDLEFNSFDLRTTVDSVIYAMAPRAERKNIEIACLIQPDVPDMVIGDPGRLRQILNNLVGNAIKFTEQGEVVIQVQRDEEIDEQVIIRFMITDTGIGIPPDRLQGIFERFVQVDSSIARKYGGTGLGLAICEQLVHMMEGEIGAESQPGQGSVFWFTVPFKKPVHPGPALPDFPVDPKSLRILSIDDNATNRMIMARMLEGFGCRTETLSRGDEIIPTLRQARQIGDPFTLIVLDMQMPEMSGEEALVAIRGDAQFNNIPVIILTSIGKRGDVTRLKTIGCNGYLVKPVRQIDLLNAIIAVLNQANQPGGLPLYEPVTRHTISEISRRDRRILLAEDNTINQKLVSALLRQAGYSIDIVNNGEEAVQAVQNQWYNLILMDVSMPVMDGLEALKQIRANERPNEHIPIVAMTAHAMQGDREAMLAVGMDGYLSKPLEIDDVLGVIERLARLTPSTAELLEKKRAQEQALHPPMDIPAALPLFMNNREFFLELFLDFIAELPQRLEQLTQSLQAQNRSSLARQAHSIKGLAANFRAEDLSQVAANIEEMASQGEWLAISNQIPFLETEITRLSAYVDEAKTILKS